MNNLESNIENVEPGMIENYGAEYFGIIKDFFNIYEQTLHNKDPNLVVSVDNELNYESLNKKISRANNLYTILYEISPNKDKFQMQENNFINTLNDMRSLYIRRTEGKSPARMERLTTGELIEKMEYFRDALKGKKFGEVIDYNMLNAINTSRYVPKFNSGLKNIIAKLFK